MKLNLNPKTFWKIQGINEQSFVKMTEDGYDGKRESAQINGIPIFVHKDFNDTLVIE